jgi:hypothetical protein
VKRGFGRVRGLGDQRRTIHPSRLPSCVGPPGHSAESLGQLRREPCETSNRIAEFDLPPGQPVQLGGFARRASSLTRHQVPECHKPLEVCMSDGSVHAHGLGDLGRRPFGLVDVEVEEDPTSRRILQRGDGSVDLGERFITHAGSLSTGNARGSARARTWPLLARGPVLRSSGPIDRFLQGTPETRTSFAELLIDCEEDRTLRAVPVGILRDTERGG